MLKGESVALGAEKPEKPVTVAYYSFPQKL
jgi:hypothetical protein